MKPVFVDTSVLLLAVGGEHPARDSCRAVLHTAAAGEGRLHLSVEAGQEFLFHRLRRGSKSSAIEQFGQLDRMVVWHAFDAAVLRAARDLVANSDIRGRDAVHAATALGAGFTEFISCDPDFDAVPGLHRIDPSDGWPPPPDVTAATSR